MPTKKKPKYRNLLDARMPSPEANRAVIVQELDVRALPVWKSMQAQARGRGIKEGVLLSILLEIAGPDLLREIGDPPTIAEGAVFVPGQE